MLGDAILMFYELIDFSRFWFLSYWYYYLYGLREGIVVYFFLRLKLLLKFFKKCFICLNGEFK